MTSRCPKCGRNNYGDIKKCSFCGAPLVFIPGEEVPDISEEDVQEKMSKMKVARLRNPFMIGSGGAVAVVGAFLALTIFLVVMLYVYDPGDVEVNYDSGMHYTVPGEEEYIFGEITCIKTDQEARWTGSSAGYNGWTAYEIDGDGVDNRDEARERKQANIEPDVWVYSEDPFGDKGDNVLIKVVSDRNDNQETRVVFDKKAPWGGSGWVSGGWIFALPGILISLGGLTILTIGIVGKADRSMERLMQEDKELRRQQIMLREAARKKMQEQHKAQQWSSEQQPAEGQQTAPMEGQEGLTHEGMVQEGQVTEQPPVQPTAVQEQAPPTVEQQAPVPQYQAPPPAVPTQEQPPVQQYQPPEQG